MDKPPNHWFPAKRYGWGWGLPRVWQGWVALAVYLAVVVGACIAYPPESGAVRFFAIVVLATAVFTAVCWVSGEPPRWSWGDKPARGADEDRGP